MYILLLNTGIFLIFLIVLDGFGISAAIWPIGNTGIKKVRWNVGGSKIMILPFGTNSINFINEYYGWCMLLSYSEQFTN